MKKEETSSNMADPPPAPNTKEHPINLLDSPIKSVRISPEDERSCSSGEEEGRKIIHPGPTDLSKTEKVTGPHNLMELVIAELKGELERNRYAKKTKKAPDS